MVEIAGVYHCYELHTDSVTREEAEQRCQDKVGGLLAAVNRQDIQQVKQNLQHRARILVHVKKYRRPQIGQDYQSETYDIS